MTQRRETIRAFLAAAGWQNASQRRIAGDASNRKYDRLTQPDGTTALLMDAPPQTGEDVRPFVEIAAHLNRVGLSAPVIYYQDRGNGLLLIEDFGDALFADLIADDPTCEAELYRAAADVLIHLRDTSTPDLPLCDADWLVEMIAPLFEWYAPDADPLQIDMFHAAFRPLTATAVPEKPVLILRDYHAQNLILLAERTGAKRVGLLDFQDALLGHPAYDLVSVLQDARRDVDPATEAATIDYMIQQTGMDPVAFRDAYACLGLQRNLRILGIFARLCLRDGKAAYVDMIPRVWGHVLRNLAHPRMTDISDALLPLLPDPTPPFLEQLKRRCPTSPL